MIGTTAHKHQDWINENDAYIQPLQEEKHYLHRGLFNDHASTSKMAAYSNIRGMVGRDLCQMQDAWLSKKADEIQPAVADSKDMKNFYGALKIVYGPTTSGWYPLLSADGNTLITDKEKVLEHWAEHFHIVLFYLQ